MYNIYIYVFLRPIKLGYIMHWLPGDLYPDLQIVAQNTCSLVACKN